jgi:hypothetical protein
MNPTSTKCVSCPYSYDLVNCVNDACPNQLCPECAKEDMGRCVVCSTKGKVKMVEWDDLGPNPLLNRTPVDVSQD